VAFYFTNITLSESSRLNNFLRFEVYITSANSIQLSARIFHKDLKISHHAANITLFWMKHSCFSQLHQIFCQRNENGAEVVFKNHPVVVINSSVYSGCSELVSMEIDLW